MSEKLILITGVNGFVGFHTLLHALNSGYRARAVVRKESQIDELKDFLTNGNVIPKAEFVVVKNLAAKGAFDRILADVDYILHVASPMNTLVTDNYERDYFRFAIDNTRNILAAAATSPSIKRVVITSSIGAILTVWQFASGVLEARTYTSDDEICHYDIKTPFPHPLLAYGARKSIALEAAQSWVGKYKPGFDLVYLMPSLVIGPNALAKTPEQFVSGTNAPLMKLLLCGKAPMPSLGSSVSIQDVAELHIKALNSEVKARRYLVAGPGHEWVDAKAVIEKHFPKAVGGAISLGGELGSIKIDVNVEKTQKEFKLSFRNRTRVL